MEAIPNVVAGMHRSVAKAFALFAAILSLAAAGVSVYFIRVDHDAAYPAALFVLCFLAFLFRLVPQERRLDLVRRQLSTGKRDRSERHVVRFLGISIRTMIAGTGICLMTLPSVGVFLFMVLDPNHFHSNADVDAFLMPLTPVAIGSAAIGLFLLCVPALLRLFDVRER